MTREQELRRQLAEIVKRHREAFDTEAKPLIDELIEIEARKPPNPIIGPDGRMYVYTGPMPFAAQKQG